MPQNVPMLPTLVASCDPKLFGISPVISQLVPFADFGAEGNLPGGDILVARDLRRVRVSESGSEAERHMQRPNTSDLVPWGGTECRPGIHQWPTLTPSTMGVPSSHSVLASFRTSGPCGPNAPR